MQKNLIFTLLKREEYRAVMGRIKEETQATIRCVPFGVEQKEGLTDMVTGKPAKYRVIIAKAY